MCIKPEYFSENNLNLRPIPAIEKQIKNGHLKVFVWLLTQLWWFCFNWGLGNFKMKLLLQRVEKMLDFETKILKHFKLYKNKIIIVSILSHKPKQWFKH